MLSTTIQYEAVHELLVHGDFTAAQKALGSEWRGLGVLPSRDGHDTHSFASLLMICGVLTAECGSLQKPLQERGKDMLWKSVRLFGDDLEGAQTAKTWLGAAYIRCGDFNEAIVLADDVLQGKNASLRVMVCAAKNKSIALDELGSPQAALETLNEMDISVEALTPIAQGKYYLQRGKILRKLGRLDESLEDYDLAMECFYAAKSQRYEAAASNNMAGVYLDRGELIRAHNLTEKAIRLWHDLGDFNQEGMAWDQTAQIYRKEGKYHEAERAVLHAIRLLEKGDHKDFLAEAYTTYGTILVEIGMSAVTPLQKAVEIYAIQNNPAQLEAVSALMWEAVSRVKKMAKDTSAAMHAAVRPIEHQAIAQALEKHHGHTSLAAKELGMSQPGLIKNIEQHFPDLTNKCQPVKPRKHSIIKTK